MHDGDKGQPGLQEANQDSLSNETSINTEYLVRKNFEYLSTKARCYIE